MKQLSEFTTLAEAQAYPETRHVVLNANDMGTIFDKHPGTLTALEAVENDNETIKIFLNLFRSGGGRFDFRTNTEDGQQLSGKLDQLIAAGVISQAFADDVIAAANPTSKPYKDITQAEFDYAQPEIVALHQNNAKHYLNLNIANDAVTPVTVEVQQRFGPDDSDLTEWHRVSQFSPQVKYKQMTYQGVVSPAPAAYRELRVVSPVTLGLTVSNA